MTVFEWIKGLLKGDVEYTNDVAALCVGLDMSRSAGPCPGAVTDALHMRDLLQRHAKSGMKVLTNSQATHAAVKSALSDLFTHKLSIFFYSGHGGRDEKDRNAAYDPDHRDEYLCLYDRMMKDDELWDLLIHARGRVVCIFDCCHSGTMFRSAQDGENPRFVAGDNPFTLRKFRKYIDIESQSIKSIASDHARMGMSHEEIEYIYSRSTKQLDSQTPDLLVWSAAKETEYSYGTASGGIFTNALLSSYGKNRSYDSVWRKIRSKMRKEPNTPVRTVFGKGFGGKVFQ